MIDRTRLAFTAAVAVALSIAMLGCAGPIGSPARSAAPRAATAAATIRAASGAVLDRPWATAELIDVSTGETFRIADLAGKVILIETMAIWCPTCRGQQRDVHAALRRLPAGSVVYVVLDTEPSEDGKSLAAYREQNGFEARYALAGAEVARALAAEFGDQVLNPPSTPMVVVGVDGRVTLTRFGQKSPDEIVALAEAHGA